MLDASSAFTDDLTQILIDFAQRVMLTDESLTPTEAELCAHVFEPEFLEKLGSGPACALETKRLRVTVGVNGVVDVTDTPLFIPDRLFHVTCTLPASSVRSAAPIQPAANPIAPGVQLSASFSATPGCFEHTLSILAETGTGNREFLSHQWTLKSTNATNTTLLQGVLQSATAAGNRKTLTFPRFTFHHLAEYVIDLRVENFAHVVSNFEFPVAQMIAEYTEVQLESATTSPVFYVWMNNSIGYLLRYFSCAQHQIVEGTGDNPFMRATINMIEVPLHGWTPEED